MARKLQILRGLLANLPTLNVGEPALTTDEGSERFYIGNGSKNLQLPILDDDGLLKAKNTPSLATLGAAPAGYGYDGAKIVDIAAASASEDDDTFNARLDSVYDTIGYNGSMQVVIVGNDTLYGVSTFLCTMFKRNNGEYGGIYGTGFGEYSVQKKRLNGVWQPWEWVNPPMLDGVEYRTTERWSGKPVYVQRVVVGALGAGTGSISHGIENMAYVVGVVGCTSYGAYLNTHPYMTYFHANTASVLWETTTAIGGTAYAILKYTKSTD